MGRFASAALLVLCLVAAYGGARAGTSTATPGPPERVIVVGDAGAATEGCGPEKAAALLLAFADAFNAGDAERVGTFVGPRFQWFSVLDWDVPPGVRSFLATDRAALVGYARDRHARNERIRLVAVSVGGANAFGGVNAGVELTRRADDLVPGRAGPDRLARGKAVVDCRTQTIEVWSVGMSQPDAFVSPRDWCVPPAATPRPDTAVACRGAGS